MVRVILTGGLGNQMFEYAAGKALALRLNKKLALDTYALSKKTKGAQRSFALNIFDLNTEISSSWKTQLIVKAFPFVERNRNLFKKIFGYFRDRSAIVYRPEFSELKGNIILHGYFQNEKYFRSYQEIIRKDFSFNQPLQGKNKVISANLKIEESVAVHIRRSDYLTDSNFAICDNEYYQRAIEEIKRRINNPHFYVFTEDFEWAKENLRFNKDKVTFVDWNRGKDSYRDMQLMSLCKHNIIANSSFSWWAAWLNSNAQKQVYAPSIWFRKEERNNDLKDFYPSDWIII